MSGTLGFVLIIITAIVEAHRSLLCKLFFIMENVKHYKWWLNSVLLIKAIPVAWLEMQTPRPTQLCSVRLSLHKISRRFLHLTVCIMNSHSPISSFNSWRILFPILYYFEANPRKILFHLKVLILRKVLIKNVHNYYASQVSPINKPPRPAPNVSSPDNPPL